MVPASFWDHEPVRRALAERHLGRVIRAYRCHPYHGRVALPQTVVAGWLGITQAQLSRVENGPPLVHLDRLSHWAELLGIPESCLWFALPDQVVAGPSKSQMNTYEEGGTTDRRQFHALAALAGIGATGNLGLLVNQVEPPRAIGMEQVQYAASLVEAFRSADAVIGANALCDAAIQVHRRLSTWAATTTYSRSVGDALQGALADLAIQAAWLAIDADRRAEARPFLDEAVTRARIADDLRVEVRALACMSLLLREDRPAEAVQCADAALRASTGWATPRLRTLLHLRAAHAHATMQDRSTFERQMTRARSEFDGGSHEDDLPFISFVTAEEVTGIGGLSYLVLGQPERAATSFRAVTGAPSAAHRRNAVYYKVQLARAEWWKGDVDEAARVGIEALPLLGPVQSGRVSRLLAEVRSRLGASAGKTPRTRAFVEAYDSVRT